jgi:aminoglycoside phosphotransferase (APT) family kinase protein
LQVTTLEGGTVNQLWRVATGAGDFVLRIDGPQARRPGVDRKREFLLHARAAAARLAPPIVAGSPDGGIMVSHFIHGRRWQATDCADRSALRRLGEHLARVHELSAPAAPFEPLRIGQAYAAAAHVIQGPHTDAIPGLLEAIARAESRFGADPAHRVIIHGDLNHLNVIETEQPWLIDWEYAQVADPLFDLGCLLAYYPEAQAQAGELLAAAGLAGPGQRSRLAIAAFIYQALSWLWQVARDESPPGPPPTLA